MDLPILFARPAPAYQNQTAMGIAQQVLLDQLLEYRLSQGQLNPIYGSSKRRW